MLRRVLVAILIGLWLAFGGAHWIRAETWRAELEIESTKARDALASVARLTTERDAARRQVTDAIQQRDGARKGAAFSNRGLVGCLAANEEVGAYLRQCRAGVRWM